jgi:2-amino-4-hydroxy-6-hydroxymethyldihydropteridine diphosphokinase
VSQAEGVDVSPRRAFLGLGSNLGDRVHYLREAIDTLRAVDLRAVSPVYETEPVGGPGGQGAYLNLVAELETARTPHDLLGVCHRIEAAAGYVEPVGALDELAAS